MYPVLLFNEKGQKGKFSLGVSLNMLVSFTCDVCVLCGCIRWHANWTNTIYMAGRKQEVGWRLRRLARIGCYIRDFIKIEW